MGVVRRRVGAAVRIGWATTERDPDDTHQPHPARVAESRERAPRRTRAQERGITTAEYAVGTAAGAGFAGLLYKLLSGGFGDQLLKTLFDHVLGLLGIK